jgi:hypothetical protein
MQQPIAFNAQSGHKKALQKNKIQFFSFQTPSLTFAAENKTN